MRVYVAVEVVDIDMVAGEKVVGAGFVALAVVLMRCDNSRDSDAALMALLISYHHDQEAIWRVSRLLYVRNCLNLGYLS